MRVLSEPDAPWDMSDGTHVGGQAWNPGWGTFQAPKLEIPAPDPNDCHSAPIPEPATPEPTAPQPGVTAPVLKKAAYATLGDAPPEREQYCRGCKVRLLPGTKSGLCAICRLALNSERHGLGW